MARKQRSRSRTATRRATQSAQPPAAAEPTRPAAESRPTTPARRSGTVAGARGAVSRSGALRAEGAPSAALLRNAEVERTYVIRDFRRIGVVVVLMVALLVVADIVVNLLLK